jgi:hypothetical protein
MRIIFPGHSYDEALVMAGCERLDNRRNTICIKTLSKIIKHGPRKEHVPQTKATAHQCKTRNSNDLSLYTSVEQNPSKIASSQAQFPR